MNLVALQQPRVGHSFFGMLVQGSACGAGGLPAIGIIVTGRVVYGGACGAGGSPAIALQ